MRLIISNNRLKYRLRKTCIGLQDWSSMRSWMIHLWQQAANDPRWNAGSRYVSHRSVLPLHTCVMMKRFVGTRKIGLLPTLSTLSSFNEMHLKRNLCYQIDKRVDSVGLIHRFPVVWSPFSRTLECNGGNESLSTVHTLPSGVVLPGSFFLS